MSAERSLEDEDEMTPHVFLQEVAKAPTEPTREEQLQSQLSQQLNLPGLMDSSGNPDQKPPPPEDKVNKLFFINLVKQPDW